MIISTAPSWRYPPSQSSGRQGTLHRALLLLSLVSICHLRGVNGQRNVTGTNVTEVIGGSASINVTNITNFPAEPLEETTAPSSAPILVETLEPTAAESGLNVGGGSSPETDSPTVAPATSTSSPTFNQDITETDEPTVAFTVRPTVAPTPSPTSAPTARATTAAPTTRRPTTASPSTATPTRNIPEPTPSPTMMPTIKATTAKPTFAGITPSPTIITTTGPPLTPPSRAPSTSPSGAPSTTPSDKGATSVPSLVATAPPTSGTQSPTPPAGTPVSSTLSNLEMTLVGLNQLMSPNAELDWKATMSQHAKEYFQQNSALQITNVVTTIKNLEQSIITPKRRGLLLRQLQTASIKVVYTQDISYQTQNEGRDTPETIVAAPFSSPQDQDTFVAALKKENDEFEDVTAVSEIVQGTGGGGVKPIAAPVEETASGLSTGALIGIIVGCVAGVVAILGIGYFVSQRGDDGGYVSSGKTPPSQLEVGNGLHGDEVSTLAEPHTNGRNGGVPNTISGESIVGYGDQSVATVDYDYSKAYGGGGDNSVSSAGGTFGSQTHTHAAGGATLGASTLGNGGPLDSSYGDGGSNFRGQNASVREELIDIYAPPGKLGVVIDTPDDGAPVVHAVKDSSVIADKLQVGDKLVAVDDEDVRSMTAIKVSKLISRKSANASRKLSIIRTVVIDE